MTKKTSHMKKPGGGRGIGKETAKGMNVVICSRTCLGLTTNL